jgi:hypothetical protein
MSTPIDEAINDVLMDLGPDWFLSKLEDERVGTTWMRG